MQLHGQNIVAGERSARGSSRFRGANPATGAELETEFVDADPAEIDRAMEMADGAFDEYRSRSAKDRAAFLDRVGAEIDALGDALIERAAVETGLGADRLKGERARTVNQLRMFARLVEEGSWVQARIDRAIPDRKPLPKPDIRRMLVPLGPVVAFSASNFPLAISVAGNDTASGLAAGCPVVVKAHPAHPGTSELVAGAVASAARETNMPRGVFSMLHGRSYGIGMTLVKHPLAKAVGFTGSLKGGRALMDAAAARAEPIPVYAEMGSTNPVFLLPGALAERGQQIATGLLSSVTLGVGQFCTCPGLVIGVESEPQRKFVSQATEAFGTAPAGTMLYRGIRDAYETAVDDFAKITGVKLLARSAPRSDSSFAGRPALLVTDAKTYLTNPTLSHEVFGPATLVINAGSREHLLEVAQKLEGHLTATIHGTPDDLRDHADLVAILEKKVGRLIFNGFPTGIEPCPSIHHGGPYPACSDGGRTTSIGTAAIERFARPLCYQNWPDATLPLELQNANPRGIWRQIDGQLTKDAVA